MRNVKGGAGFGLNHSHKTQLDSLCKKNHAQRLTETLLYFMYLFRERLLALWCREIAMSRSEKAAAFPAGIERRWLLWCCVLQGTSSSFVASRENLATTCRR